MIPWISGELVFPLIRAPIKANGSVVAVSVSTTLPCIGTLCRVVNSSSIEGISRIRIEYAEKDRVKYTEVPDAASEGGNCQDLVDAISKKVTPLMGDKKISSSNPNFFAYALMAALLRGFPGVISAESEGQALLEQVSLPARLAYVSDVLDQCIVAFNQTKSQLKELVIRRQISQLQKQLPPDELDGLSGKKFASSEISQIFSRELKRLKSLQSHHPEYHVILNYLETLASLPIEESGEMVEISEAKKILENSHFGLLKVKQRILENLAVWKRVGSANTILCLSGPPGIGKTSIASSIAAAMDRKFARVSLGGIRDESELRGHRKTYIGAMPGLIVQALIRSKATNPVILLDEIDKVGNRGLGVLLEILDPTQNSAFRDAFLNFGIDLSRCVFLATCNDPSLIPPPLMDRMELIELEGYSEQEKVEICRNFLVPKNLKLHALPDLSIDTKLIESVIAEYTMMEAGVRDLDRRIAQICRHCVLNEKNSIEKSDFPEIFGPPKILAGPTIPSVLPVGVSLGLAVSALGGDVLFIEAAKTMSDQKVLITGQLGEVMQESVRIALSLLSFEAKNLHIHFPSGGVRKDGPSAGVSTWIALASLLTNIPAPSNLAATGEITLRGTILPVGGIRAKLLAAHRAGLRRVIIPESNKTCLSDVPTKVLADLDVILVNNIKQVWELLFAEKLLATAKL